MKKLKYIVVIIQLFVLSIECNSQINQLAHEKYWFYRKRLVNEFLASGEEAAWLQNDKDPIELGANRKYLAGCGLSIPARKIENTKALKFTEGTVELGNYICVLATELRLLYDYGQPYENTQRELYYALKAVKRVDLAAEILIDGNSGVENGFFLRNDVDFNLIDNFPFLADQDKGEYIAESNMLSAYQCGYYENMGSGIHQEDTSVNAFPTQDQISGLFLGFALVKKCLEGIPSISVYNGYNFIQKVKEYTYKIINRIEGDDWYIKFDNDDICRWGYSQLCEGNAYGIAKAADYLTDNQYDFASWFQLDEPIKLKCIISALFDDEKSLCESLDECSDLIVGIQKNMWNTKAAYDGDGTKLFDAMMYIGDADFSATLVFAYAVIANWSNDNRTSDALKFYGKRYNVEIYPMIHNYIHSGLTYDSEFKSKIKSYINTAPCNGPHYYYRYPYGIPGWLGSNRWHRPILAYSPDPEGGDIERSGFDYMLLYNLMWLEKSHISDLFSISQYTYPEYYIYPLKCLNKAYYPLNVKTYEPLSLPDEYSDELYLNSSTPYQNGTYHFEAPEITFGPNFSINGPAEFVISNDVEYDLCYEQAKTYDFTIQRTDNVCTDDFSYPGYDCISMCCPLIADNNHSDMVTYKWRFRNSQGPVTGFVDVGYEKSFEEWDEYVVPGATYIECAAYYNGILVRNHIESFNYNNPDICCRGPLRNADTDEKNNSEDINVMPNPVEDYIEIVNINEQATIEIYNSQGEKVYSISSDDNKVRINAADYPKGFYFVKVITSEQIKQFKVICK